MAAEPRPGEGGSPPSGNAAGGAGPAGPPAPGAGAPPTPTAPIGGAFGLPGGTLGVPGGMPMGLFTGPPGGISGPPGGVAPQALAPLTLLAPLPGAMQAGGLAPPPAGAGTCPGGAMPLAGTPSYLPGAAPAIALPDLAAAARQALEGVVAEAHPAPPPVAKPAPAVPGVWRPPPPQPTGGQIDRTGWHDAYAAQDRDLAQRVGDRLYPLVERLRESRLSWLAVVALFGITVPIILLRQSFDARLRVVLAAFTFLFWVGLLQDIF